MDSTNQLTQLLDWRYLFAREVIAICISLTASVILFGIWRRDYPEIDAATGKRTARAEGAMWMFWACALWCWTAAARAVGLILSRKPPGNSLPIMFIWVELSLTNSLFFILATANLDAVRADSRFLAKTMRHIRARRYWILAFLIGVAAILCWVTKPEVFQGKLCTGFDALVDVLTIVLIGWGFFQSFQKRGFPVVAWLSVAVFLVFMVAELGWFLSTAMAESPFTRNKLLGMALSIAADGMVALLFVASTFSWVHEPIDIHSIPEAIFREVEHTEKQW